MSKLKLKLWLREVGGADIMGSQTPGWGAACLWRRGRPAGWFPSWQIFSPWLKGGTVRRLPASVPHHLPQEVSGSRWEVMEVCGSVGGDMTSCQALMQPNIWKLRATSFLACWQAPLAWSQEPPPGPATGPRRQRAAAVMLNDSTPTSAVEKGREAASPLCVLHSGLQ